jgi:hypothetical protein
VFTGIFSFLDESEKLTKAVDEGKKFKVKNYVDMLKEEN